MSALREFVTEVLEIEGAAVQELIMANDEEVNLRLMATDVRTVPLTLALTFSVLEGDGWIRAEGTGVPRKHSGGWSTS